MNPLDIICQPNVPMPMRDGTVLRANIYRPAGDQRLPALLMRTPYGKPPPRDSANAMRYARAGYVMACQDMRGRYASDGVHTNFLIPAPQEAEDGYDSVEWMAAQPWCDGNVGTLGASYCAWAQWMGAKLRPPHLRAMAAISIPPELRDVDWPGAFRPGRRLHWLLTAIAPDLRRRSGEPGVTTPAEAIRNWEELEHGAWIGMLPWSQLPDRLPGGLGEALRQWLSDPGAPLWKLDEAWGEIEAPNLDLTGWYDHCNGTIAHLPGMQRHARSAAAREQTRLVIGPWSHVTLGARKVGDVDFGAAAEVDQVDLLIRWFDHWLKGIDNGINREPAVRYFVMGSGQWRSAPTWPPPEAQPLSLYLRQEGRLSDRPGGEEPPDAYRYDPCDPVPSLWSGRYFTQPSDRRRLDHRGDILRYRSAPLEEAMEIAGEPEMILYAASSAPDTDFFARLVDEAPEGPAMEISYGMVRARHRNGLDRQDLLTPGRFVELRIRLGPTACRFAPGHRLRLEITSSDFPNHDRNHNVGRNDLFDAELAVAHQQVAHCQALPSRLILPRIA